MGAKCFINGDETLGLPWATDYYARYETHAIGRGATIKRARYLDYKPFSFLNFIDAIKRNVQTGDDVLICCHGARRALGLFPAKSGSDWMSLEFARRMASLDESLSTAMGLSDTEWEKLTDDIMAIRKLKISHLAIRACNIGNNPELMKNLGRVIGAKSVSGPTLRTAYINTDVIQISGDSDLLKYKAEYPQHFQIPSRIQGKLVLASKKLKRSRYKCVLLTDSAATVADFLVENFPSMPILGKSAKYLTLHGLIVPEAPHKFYFPLDPRYLSHIAYYDTWGK